jgi:hypothetical protein
MLEKALCLIALLLYLTDFENRAYKRDEDKLSPKPAQAANDQSQAYTSSIYDYNNFVYEA